MPRIVLPELGCHLRMQQPAVPVNSFLGWQCRCPCSPHPFDVARLVGLHETMVPGVGSGGSFDCALDTVG